MDDLPTSKHHTTHDILIHEAAYIRRLFPSEKIEYIISQLKLFEDMSNRKEIVMRIIAHSRNSTNASRNPNCKDNFAALKRSNLQASETVKSSQPKIKVRKLAELSVPVTTSKQQEMVSTSAITPVDLSQVSQMSTTEKNILPTNYIPLNFPLPSVISEDIQETTSVIKPTKTSDDSFKFKPATVTSSDSSTSALDAYEFPNYLQPLIFPLNLKMPLPQDLTLTSQDNQGVLNGEENYIKRDNQGLVQTENNSLYASNVPQQDSQGSDQTEIYVLDGLNSQMGEKQDFIQLEIHPLNISNELEINSQDSNQTEIYPVQISSSEKKEKLNVNLPINLSQNMKENEATCDKSSVNLRSTSKAQDRTDQADGVFNLVERVYEITRTPKDVIERCCKRLEMPLNAKPTEHALNMLVNDILATVGDLNDSDVENIENNKNDLGNGDVDLTNDVSVIEVETLGKQLYNSAATSTSQYPEEGATAVVPSTSSIDIHLVNTLCSIFPEACPNYIRDLCKNKTMNNETMDALITIILNTNNNYPKRPRQLPEPEVFPENQLEILQELLPDADPDYLSMMCDQFEGNPEKVKLFINKAMEKRDYPTMKDYQRRQQLSAQQKQYTTDFSVENFIKIIPNPEAFFKDPSRNLKLNQADCHYALIFMRNKFNKLPIRMIQVAFTKCGCNVSKTVRDLEKAMTKSGCTMKTIRKPVCMPNNIQNIPLLQEIAYYTHEEEIKEYLKQQKEQKENERREAKSKGLMKTCSCCYDDEVLPKDIFYCENGCEFCQDCIVKSSEVRFGQGKLDFPCLMNCQGAFSLQTLQVVLPPKLFSRIAQKKVFEEVKAAGIEELEACPFCDFATIPAAGYNIFTCMNPECMKESCRICKEPSHIPLRCEEIEKDEDVKARIFVENKMTEALLKKCYKCGVKFFKEEGCNKMTCSCGAQMCYVCGKPVTSYKHFNGMGGDRYDLCPLYSDTNVLNKENVLRGAKEAKAKIGNVDLKYDPTADINEHYRRRRNMYPPDPLLAEQVRPVFRPLD